MGGRLFSTARHTVFSSFGSVFLLGGKGRLLIELRSVATDRSLGVRAHVTVVEADREIESRLLLVVVEFALEVLGASWRSRAQRHSQKLICSPSFHVLLIKQIKQKILISLDQPLRIDLSMLQLFIPVPLNSLQQCAQRLLLFLPQ